MILADRSTSTFALILSCAACSLLTPSCGGDDDTAATGGTTGTGGVRTGGASTGGFATGGVPPATGGTAPTGGTVGTTGGTAPTGGTATAGTGGAVVGGATTGGAGGATTGGAGGATTGGAGGATTGGAGGATTGGAGGATTGGAGGATTGGAGGTTTGGAGGTTTGGAATGGAITGGAGGATTGGATTGGAGGSTTGGATTGGAETGGAGGATTGGTATGGAATGGTGGGPTETILYDFEVDAQGWTPDSGVTAAVSTEQFVTGASSLKVTVPALAADTNKSIGVSGAALWPGTVVTLHVWSPAGSADGLYVQGFSQYDNYNIFDPGTTNTVAHNGNAAHTVVRGGWTTWTYTIQNTFPGGLQKLGIQIGASGAAFPGGDFYVDSISVSGGVQSCAGTGTGGSDFETNITGWAVDTTPADTAISQSTTQVATGGGTNSLKVAFTALPAPATGMATQRNVFLDKPAAYCGQVVTYNVYTPTGADAFTFEAFAQSDGYGTWSHVAPTAITRDGWTQFTFTLPQIGPRGLQRLGIQFNYTGTVAYTGDFFIDNVSWQ